MKIIVAHEGKQHSFQTAKALQNNGMLLAYITTVYDKKGSFTHILKHLLRGNAKKKCSSRRDPEIDDNKVVQYCELKGLLLLLIQRVPGLKRFIPQYYRSLHDDFGLRVAKYAIRNKADAVIMYDTNSNSCFRYLKKHAPDIKRILDVTIGNRLFLKKIYQDDMDKYPCTASLLQEEQREVFNTRNQARLKEELDLSNYFLAGSSFVKHSLEYSGVDATRIFVVNYGVNLKQFTAEDKQYDKGPLRLLFTGNCSYRKGVHHLLAVVSEFSENEVVLSIAGGYDANSALYKRYSSCCNIEFLGFVTRDILHKVYQKSDVFVLPSLAEGFAMVSLEAMSAGLPVICTTNSGCNDIIVDGKNGFVIDVSDEDQLKNKLEWFLSNKQSICQMSIEAKKAVSDHSWDDYGLQLCKCVNSIKI